MTDKRLPTRDLAQFFRIPVGLPVDYDGRKLMIPTRITNISKTGLFIATKAPLTVGSTGEFRFQLPGVRSLLCIQGVVRWSRGSPASERPVAGTAIGMGVEFVEVSRANQRLILDFIERFILAMRQT